MEKPEPRIVTALPPDLHGGYTTWSVEKVIEEFTDREMKEPDHA